jgi:hypothetical protein
MSPKAGFMNSTGNPSPTEFLLARRLEDAAEVQPVVQFDRGALAADAFRPRDPGGERFARHGLDDGNVLVLLPEREAGLEALRPWQAALSLQR